MKLIVTEEIVRELREKRLMFEIYMEERRLCPGDVLEFDEHGALEPYCGVLEGYSIPTIGAFSYVRSSLPTDMKIGRYCSLAPGVTAPWPRHSIEMVTSSICTSAKRFTIVRAAIEDFKPDYSDFYHSPQKPAPVLGHDVWVGQGVQLMPGITIGHGAVVAAGSVVTKSVEPYAIVGGNPAKLIKMRFAQPIVTMLLRSEWWRYKLTDFRGLRLDEPERFCDQLQEANLEPWAPKPIRLRDLVRTSDRGGNGQGRRSAH